MTIKYRFTLHNIPTTIVKHENAYSYRVGDQFIENGNVYTIVSLRGLTTNNTDADIEGVVVKL